jgi:hypothetical protein
MIKNGYSNNDNRLSFSIEMSKCNNQLGSECIDNEEELKYILDHIYFSFFTLESKAEMLALTKEKRKDPRLQKDII